MFELSEAQKAELDRRLANHREDPKRGIPWEEVKAKLLEGDGTRKSAKSELPDRSRIT